MTTQFECTKGNRCPLTSLKTQDPCPVGTYQDEKRQSSCKLCPAGRICNSLKTINPSPCPKGIICLLGKFIDCVAGYYCLSGTSVLPTNPICNDLVTPDNNPNNCPIPCPIGNFCPSKSFKSIKW